MRQERPLLPQNKVKGYTRQPVKSPHFQGYCLKGYTPQPEEYTIFRDPVYKGIYCERKSIPFSHDCACKGILRGRRYILFSALPQIRVYAAGKPHIKTSGHASCACSGGYLLCGTAHLPVPIGVPRVPWARKYPCFLQSQAIGYMPERRKYPLLLQNMIKGYTSQPREYTLSLYFCISEYML